MTKRYRCIGTRMVSTVGAYMLVGSAFLSVPSGASAHHSYAMFDASATATVTGTVAKLEWVNPHVFVWVYVRNPSTAGGYDLYAFENGSTNVLARIGWSKTTLTAGEEISVEYWPLKDGRTGGHFVQVTFSDGRVIKGAGGPNLDRALPVFDSASSAPQ